MQFQEFSSLLEKHGLLYAIYGISLPSPKSGISYVICGIYFPSPKTWAIICNIQNFFLVSKNMEIYGTSFLSLKTWNIICNFWNFFPFSKNVDYHKQFLEFLSLLQ